VGEGRAKTQPQRLTSGTDEAEPSASLDGRIAFTSRRSDFDIWSVPIDPNQGKPRGPLERLIGGATQDNYPSVSNDEKKLVFVSDRAGNWDVWVKDLESGEEAPITITPEHERRAAISPDGAQVAYIRREETQTNLYAVSVAGGTEKRLIDNIGSFTGWAPDSRRVVYWSSGERIQFRTVDLRTGEHVDIVQHPEYDVHSAAFSPDGRWLSLKLLIDPGRIESTYIAPVRAGKAVDPSQWIRITEGQYDSRNGWSPDGNLLYFWSRRDGSTCLWAQRLAPETKKPVGSLIEIQHFHTPRRSVRAASPWGFTKGRLYLPIIDRTGNIWLAEPQEVQ
jgi:Tol biopolymer transport system component